MNLNSAEAEFLCTFMGCISLTELIEGTEALFKGGARDGYSAVKKPLNRAQTIEFLSELQRFTSQAFNSSVHYHELYWSVFNNNRGTIRVGSAYRVYNNILQKLNNVHSIHSSFPPKVYPIPTPASELLSDAEKTQLKVWGAQLDSYRAVHLPDVSSISVIE